MADDEPVSEGTHGLTSKQRDVLELLIQRKTSKEIARILAISPYTVDQRIAAARKKFGVSTRNELAAAYQPHAAIYQGLAYQSSHMEFPRSDVEQGVGTTQSSHSNIVDPDLSKFGNAGENVLYYRVVPELFEGPAGIWLRLVAIGLIAMLLLVVVLSGVAAFGQLSDVLH